MRLLKGTCGFTAVALVVSGAFAQDRPDLMDVDLGTFYNPPTAMGAPVPPTVQVINDGGKGQPLSGANNKVGRAYIDGNYAFVRNTLVGTVPVTAALGTRVNLMWYNNEFDKSQRSGNSAKVDQKAELGFRARILVVTPMGASTTAVTAMGASLAWTAATSDGMGVPVAGGLDDCSAKFQAKGVPTPVTTDPAPVPTSAKWQAKCKQTTYGALLTAIGVPAANATTVLQGLGVPATDKVSIKGGS